MNPHQRINIQYSISMDELPEEVTRVYSKSVEQLRNIELPELSETEILNSSVTKMIDEARQQLAKTDLMLADVQSIVSSYVEYEIALANANNQSQSAKPQGSNENTNQDGL